MATCVIYTVGIRNATSMYKDQERQPKPLIDEYMAEEFDQWICYARERNLAVAFITLIQ